MEKIMMTIVAETMGKRFRELKVEYEALLVAEGKSKRIKSRPQPASSPDQTSI